MAKTGINLIEVKERNRALLLQSICTAGTITRSELSEQLQLSPMTVTNITSELLQHHIIEEVAQSDPVKAPGRTPMLLRIGAQSPVILGIYISRACLHGVVCELSMQLLTQIVHPLSPSDSMQSLVEKLRTLVEDLFSKAERPILALGLSTVGMVNKEKTGIAYVTDFFGIHTIDLKQILQPDFPFPIFVENNITAAGLSELYFGAGHDVDDFLYLGITDGLGAAVVLHREVLDSCSEFGHISIDDNGPLCSCGSRGCLELYASTPTILAKIREECGVELKNMEQAARFALSNPIAFSIFYNALQHLAYGLNNYLNLINISTIILGHDAFLLPEDFVELLKQLLVRINISVRRQGHEPRFIKAKFGENSPIFGSICIVLQHLFHGDLLERLIGLA